MGAVTSNCPVVSLLTPAMFRCCVTIPFASTTTDIVGAGGGGGGLLECDADELAGGAVVDPPVPFCVAGLLGCVEPVKVAWWFGRNANARPPANASAASAIATLGIHPAMSGTASRMPSICIGTVGGAVATVTWNGCCCGRPSQRSG